MADAYDAVYYQFDILMLERHYFLGFVITPNHGQALLAMRDKGESINKHIETMKGFLAYELVQQLQKGKKTMFWKNYQREQQLRIKIVVN